MTDQHRVAIVGSRGYPRLFLVADYVRMLAERHPDAVVISGGARGVDSAAEREAMRVGLRVSLFPADWDRYGKAAGFKRNAQIVEACSEIVAFWDGQSRGTMHTVNTARDRGKPVTLFDSGGRIIE